MSELSDLITREEFNAALRTAWEDIDKLTEAITALVEVHEQQPGTADAARSNRWCWRTVTGADRERLWTDLAAWVDWFNDRYGSASAKLTVPPCWPSHPVAVEELTGLMLAWQAAHASTAPSDAPLAWHDRWLWPCLDRLHTRPGTFEHCTANRHDLRHSVPPVTTDATALAAAMATQGRGEVAMGENPV
ncbi:DUF4913 domain-containing protein [Actinotalea sp. K2]|uniref:DUF4913 domain-containing protein n=1 Tax=Actinotalea sp. K2 TaxID=2939438 RepID=UPI002016E9C8|nr:DUF4913 domain-containing protein [Actinotalea sp. K2]MCL3863032.1 DUF4913 domain-containing protein [Actinotalea sp. K2]